MPVYSLKNESVCSEYPYKFDEGYKVEGDACLIENNKCISGHCIPFAGLQLATGYCGIEGGPDYAINIFVKGSKKLLLGA